MDVTLTLASEVTERSLWYPTIQGILVALCAVALFFGSIYLLLATNMGARLGFLVAFTGLAGFMVVLTLLWSTTSFPLNTVKGSLPGWEVVGVYDSLEAAPSDVRNIEADGHEADAVEAADVKGEVDENLVTATAEGTEELPPDANEYALFAAVTDYQVTNTWLQGGSDPNPLRLEFTHTPRFAVAQFCENRAVDVLPGLPPPDPECASDGESGVIVMERNLGSLRLPPIVAMVSSWILFGLGLLSLHWYERDRQRVAAAATPTPANT